MSLTVDLLELLSLIGVFFGAWVSLLIAGGKILLKQIDARFVTQEKGRAEAQKHWDEQFSALQQNGANEAKEWQRIEREIMGLKADLPVAYVRRDDFIRVQSIIESKIDGLALRIENALLRGDK
jgi:hypothetical protein